MYKVIALYGTPKDPEHFRSYYENKHLPLAARLPGLMSSHYSFSIQGTAACFCIWEGVFADADAALASMGSDIGQQVAADVSNYADGGFTLLHFGLMPGPVAATAPAR